MKINRQHLIIGFGLIMAISAACGFSASTAKITEAFTAREVNGVPESTTTFSQDEVFYLLVTLTNAPDDTVTKAVWYAANAEGVDKDTKIDEAEFKSGDQKVTFNLSNDKGWPAGDYKVELYLNNKLDRTLEFKVEESQATTNTPGGSLINDAYMISKAGGNTNRTDVYSTDEPFYLIVALANAPETTLTKASWSAVDVVGTVPNTLIDEAEFQGNGEITFDLSNNGPWPIGTYQVKVYVNNVLDRSVQFKVDGNSAPTSGSNTGSGSVEIVNAYTAREVNGNFEKTNVYSTDEVFHCVVDLSKISPNTKIKAEWQATDVKGFEANSSLYISEGSSQTDELVFDLSNTNPWLLGKYTVLLSLDGKNQRSVEFTVE
jgi:hypothetical protein